MEPQDVYVYPPAGKTDGSPIVFELASAQVTTEQRLVIRRQKTENEGPAYLMPIVAEFAPGQWGWYRILPNIE